jgi:hypothetical protein
VEEVGAASAGSGKAAARQGRARGKAQSGAGVAGMLHMAGRMAAARGQKNRGEGREVDEEELKRNILKT